MGGWGGGRVLVYYNGASTDIRTVPKREGEGGSYLKYRTYKWRQSDLSQHMYPEHAQQIETTDRNGGESKEGRSCRGGGVRGNRK